MGKNNPVWGWGFTSPENSFLCRSATALVPSPCPREGFADELQPEGLLGLNSKGIKGFSFWFPFPEIPGLGEPVAWEGMEIPLNVL